MRLDLAQYNELATFAQFGSDLDKSSQAQLERGKRMVELLKQDQYVPMPVEKQVVVLFAGANEFVDDAPVDQVRRWEAELLGFFERRHAEILKTIREKKIIEDALKPQLESAIKEFKGMFKA